MKIIIIGLGIQGKKRVTAGGSDVVAIVDPNKPEAQYKDVRDVPLASFDAAMVCTGEQPKLEILEYLLSNKKHVLVEKPLMAESNEQLQKLKELAEKNKLACYTAYNHRFEKAIQQAKSILSENKIGRIYVAKLFYGNGTARDVRNSKWRDHGVGVLHDLGSHLLDLLNYLVPNFEGQFSPFSYQCFENKSFDYFHFGNKSGAVSADIEVTLLSWKNTFKIDLIGEAGSLHIDGLCKWGSSTLSLHTRILPSGKPPIVRSQYELPDDTWSLEYEHFKALCKAGKNTLDNDIRINTVIAQLTSEVM